MRLEGPCGGRAADRTPRARTGRFLGSHVYTELVGTRKGIVYNGQLYVGVRVGFGAGSETSKKGQIWTWTGPWITRSSSRPPGAGPAQINLFYGHIVTNTWHRNSVMTNPVGGVWMSPAIPTGGLAAADTNNWKRLFVYEQYQPDPFM